MKVKRVLALFAAIIVMVVGAKADSIPDVPPVGFALGGNSDGGTQFEVKNADLKPTLRVRDISELKLPELKEVRVRGRGVSTTPQDIAGSYVMTYNTMLSSGYNGGGNSYIVADEDCDSITIRGFWSLYAVRGYVDRQAGTVTIPCQEILYDETYGVIILTTVTHNGVVDRNTPIVGVVLEDGRIDFRNSYWALTPKTGTYANELLEAYGNYILTPPTGRMEFTANFGEASYPVLVEQTTANVVKVTNFYNCGLTMEIILNTDRTSLITNQTVMVNSYGSWNTIKCLNINSEGRLTSYEQDIVTEQNAEDNNTTISWTNWSVMTSGYFAGLYPTGKLTAYTPLSFPTLQNVTMEGEGTEADPYRVSSLEHLLLISDNVSKDTDYSAVDSSGNKYAASYKDKYFVMTNDIDTKGYRFTPIGATSSHRFAGTFDGKGYTIKDVNVKGATRYFSGLFGLCDANSTLKNIVLDTPVVSSSYYYAAGLVASSEGVVDNITVIAPSVSNSGTVIAAGVVGVSQKVTNCKVEGGKIQAYGYSGSIVGEAHGDVENCSAVGTTLIGYGSNLPVGGIVGNLYHSTVRNSYFNGEILAGMDGTQVYGGIAGNVSAGAVEKSFFVGKISAYSNAMVGGIAGRLQGSINNCYSVGNIDSKSSRAGGMVGAVLDYNSPSTGAVTNSEIKNSYTTTYLNVSIEKKTSERTPEVVGYIDSSSTLKAENTYFDKQVINLGSSKYASSTPELTAANGPAGFDSSVWLFAEGYYPRLKGLENEATALYGAANILLPLGSTYRKVSKNADLHSFAGTVFKLRIDTELKDEGSACKIANDKLVIDNRFGNDTICVINEKLGMQLEYPISIVPVSWSGEGIADNPYLIKTKDDLLELGRVSSLYNQTFLDTYFVMTNDIDMEWDESFTPINCSGSDYGFSGVFDGKNYTIHKMAIRALVWQTESTGEDGVLSMSYSRKYVGMFGYISKDGIVKNINMAADCDFDDIYGESGVIAAVNGGLIENCRNYADITGYGSDIGGIAGTNGYYNSSARIVNCYNAGNVTCGLSGAGGIVGYNYGSVENCVNTGNIDATKLSKTFSSTPYASGGISGIANGARFVNCANYGTISADNYYVGGIVGYMISLGQSGTYGNQIDNCMSVGSIVTTAIANVGAMAGASTNLTNHAKSYYDVQLIGKKAIGLNNATGINGLETPAMISGEPLDGLDANVWDFTAGIYPALKSFASEQKVAAMRKAPMSIPAGYTTSDLRADATLSNDYTWSIQRGEVFRLDGLTLKAPATVETLVTDTVYAKNSLGIVRTIIIKAAPINPLSGNGTVESPYLINTVEEWNANTVYMNAVSDDMLDRYFQINADLDFTDKSCERLGNNGVVIFNGTLDGANHTMKGLALQMISSTKGALIGTLGKYGTVKNLTIEGSQTGKTTYTTPLVDKLYGKLDNVVCNVSVESTSGFTSGVVGRAYSGAVLNKVVNKGSVTSTGTYLCGIVAFLEDGVKMTDCGNEGCITYNKKTASSYVGGLVAQAKGASMVRCYNKGEVKTNNSSTCGAIGGLIANASAPNVLYDLVECWNEGTLTGSHKIGGLIADASALAQFNLLDCHNSGTINGVGASNVSNSPIAGLVTTYTPGSVYTNCWNEGEIKNDNVMYTAGIAGYMAKDIPTTNPVTFKNCYNKGTINGFGGVTAGIVAIVSGAVNIEDSYNVGTVNGSQIVSGIVGSFTGDSPTITCCYNTGSISATQGCVGGLIAYGTSTNGYTSLSWNKGNVETSSTVKSSNITSGCAIGGIAGTAASTFADCFNAGSVKGMLYVGGIVGLPAADYTCIYQAYNIGTITADADACGGILGFVNSNCWTSENQLANVYYLDSSVTSDMAKGTALSMADLAKQKIGNNWTSADDYSLPIQTVFNNNDEALVHSASIILRDEDTYTKVTKTFYIGTPDGVEWSASNDNVSIEGNRVKLKSIGDVIMTAKRGDCSKSIQLYIGYSGVEGLDADNEIVNIKYFTTDGVQVKAPTTPDGNIYIVVIKYKDGTIKRFKQLNR